MVAPWQKNEINGNSWAQQAHNSPVKLYCLDLDTRLNIFKRHLLGVDFVSGTSKDYEISAPD